MLLWFSQSVNHADKHCMYSRIMQQCIQMSNPFSGFIRVCISFWNISNARAASYHCVLGDTLALIQFIMISWNLLSAHWCFTDDETHNHNSPECCTGPQWLRLYLYCSVCGRVPIFCHVHSASSQRVSVCMRTYETEKSNVCACMCVYVCVCLSTCPCGRLLFSLHPSSPNV